MDLVALDQALSRLAALDPQQSQVVELRFSGESWPKALCNNSVVSCCRTSSSKRSSDSVARSRSAHC